AFSASSGPTCCQGRRCSSARCNRRSTRRRARSPTRRHASSSPISWSASGTGSCACRSRSRIDSSEEEPMLRILVAVASFGWTLAFAQVPAMPKSAVTLNVVDVAGNLALTQDAIENYRAKHPNLVSRITFTKAPSPELPGKIKAQQGAKRVDIDLVLTGTDALAAGIEQGPWTQ